MSKPQRKSEVVGPGVRIPLLQMGSAYLLSRALHVAAELGIADYLTDGSKSPAELAEATNCDKDALYRLLRMLASNGVFAEDAQGHFGLTPLANALRSDIEGSLRDAIRMVDETWWNAYGHLTYSVRTGQPAFAQVTGLKSFEYHSCHPEVNERFANGMANFGSHENRLIAAAYNFSQFECIVDVGGGRGGLIAEILKAYPTIRGILYDRADVVNHPDCIIAGGLDGRCELVAGDFFTSVPAGGDLYVMKRIIHDWDDDRSALVLGNCKQAMGEKGRILTIDAVIPSGNGSHPAKDSDLLMMALLGGRERTEEEFRCLYGRAGLQLTKIIPTPSLLSIVEGILQSSANLEAGHPRDA